MTLTVRSHFPSPAQGASANCQVMFIHIRRATISSITDRGRGTVFSSRKSHTKNVSAPMVNDR